MQPELQLICSAMADQANKDRSDEGEAPQAEGFASSHRGKRLASQQEHAQQQK